MFVYKITLTKTVILTFEDQPTRPELLAEAQATDGDVTEFYVEELGGVK